MSALNLHTTSALLLAAAAIACGGEVKSPSNTAGVEAAPKAASVTPTGRVIEVQMTTDERCNFFTPAKLEVHRGDILRFVLKTGVHNVNFLADSNAG